MTAGTHMLGGVLTGQLVVLAIAPRHPELLVVAAVMGALVPDIDHRQSKISKSSMVGQVASLAVSGVTHHRGVLHTPAFMLICAVILSAISFFAQGIGPTLAIGLIVGMGSHLLLDTLNPGGIMWLWPICKKRIKIAKIPTHSVGEMLFAVVLVGFNIWVLSMFFPDINKYLEHVLGCQTVILPG